MADKHQALYEFWSSFGLQAFDVSTVPSGEFAPSFPYITYEDAIGQIGQFLPLTASLWYRDTSWEGISKKVDEISRAIGLNGYYSSKVDGGYLWISQGIPFAQRMDDPSDDMIRRYFININAEFLTAY